MTFININFHLILNDVDFPVQIISTHSFLYVVGINAFSFLWLTSSKVSYSYYRKYGSKLLFITSKIDNQNWPRSMYMCAYVSSCVGSKSYFSTMFSCKCTNRFQLRILYLLLIASDFQEVQGRQFGGIGVQNTLARRFGALGLSH